MSSRKPFFSIIIPTFARRVQLAECLHAIAQSEYPRERFEVIVVDDGSGAPPSTIVEHFSGSLNVKLLTQTHAGPAAARNTGATQAQGEFFAFTDDDCVTARDWLPALASHVASTPDHIVGGRTVNGLPDNPYAVTSQVIVDIAYAHYNPDPSRCRFFASNNLTVPATGFRTIGGFDAAFTTSEDRDLCDRWLHHGYRMTYAGDVVVNHAHPLSFWGFWWQHFNYGRGALRFHQARVSRGADPFRPEWQFYRHLFGYPFIHLQGRKMIVVALLLLMSQLANCAGFFWELSRRLRPWRTARPLWR
jgi:glycosyltransferase involved in cell wall biosynthesis